MLDWTKSGVVEIDSPGGTGFVVDEHTIATAAHCVYGKKINTIYLFDNNNKPSLTLNSSTIVEYHVPLIYASSESADYDYALITVKEDLSDYMCFNLGTVTDIKNLKSAVSITGFPGEIVTGDGTKPVNYSVSEHNMYTGNSHIYNSSDKRLYYDVDTTSGNSGGPVYLTEIYNNKVYYTVIAIHTKSGGDGNYNSGTRITAELLKFFNGNPNLQY
ncbi:MAG: serine protease [Ruminococcus sp.]|nr:serine protease [Ruminococcus sp.]